MKTRKKMLTKKMLTKKIFNNKIQKWKNITNKRYSHKINKLGYRSDCSGLVSYMWNLNPKYGNGGPRTRGKGKNNLKYWSRNTTKKNLKRGDILLVPNNHVILFDKWSNKNKKTFSSYEMCDIKKCRGYYHRKKMIVPYDKKIRKDFVKPLLRKKR